ncbi:MAG: right-handed parallel beta-helix repeat-containing protein [Marinilabiliales bacterium]|nr:right-handed parallel beta-helix repeat-containing protein [Marinilabiliales bacterium]
MYQPKFQPFRSELLMLFLLLSLNSFSQGRMLRGEVWKDYSLSDTKADFYVATNGRDDWSGTLPEPNKLHTDGPFATLGKAREAVRTLKTKIYLPKKPALDKRYVGSPHPYGTGRDILVLLREGVYPLDSTLTFNESDGGERVETELPTGAFEYHHLKDYFVTYAAYPGEKAVISGGKRIIGWKKNGVKWQATINGMAITELFADGVRQTLARTPNKGFFATDGQPTDPGIFSFFPGQLKNWKGLEDARLTMIVRWGAIHSSLSRVDENKHLAYLKTPDPEMLNVPPKYYLENLEALLDTTSEWFFDPKTHLLSFIPPKQIADPNLATILTPSIPSLVKASGSKEHPLRNLRFYQLTFSTTKPGDRATLDFNYAKNCEIIGNLIENTSQTAIYLGKGCYHNLVDKNIIQNITGSGIAVLGSPQPENWADLVSDNRVSRNQVANLRPAMVGIRTANALRTTIARNYVTNTGSYGITVGSWPNVEESSDGSHLVEYNHVSFTNMARDDEGAIAVYGLSPGSVVRENLIHDVKPAATNENVGLFFQNMASGWTLNNNILYGLKQAEVKYCAAYPEDNHYFGNLQIERPVNEPEKIIEGEAAFSYSQLHIETPEPAKTGSVLEVRAMVKNEGSTGNIQVPLYADGIAIQWQLFPVIKGNSRIITFHHQFFTPGNHRLAIGNTPEQSVLITGDTIRILCSDLQISGKELPVGDTLRVTAMAKNNAENEQRQVIPLLLDNQILETREILLKKGASKLISFAVTAKPGTHSITIGNLPPISFGIFSLKRLAISQNDLRTFCSATAKPCSYSFSVADGTYSITAAGTDFLHAEDSYGTIYLPKAVKGNFVATVKVSALGEGVSDWFRFGIFVRNKLEKPVGAVQGEPGSVLMFSTPKRHGVQWDEFGDGSMHNSRSFNYNLEKTLPVWLKLVRHGNSISGYYSLDGKTWILSRESGQIASMAERLDIGLAAGSNDQKPSKVQFEEWMIWTTE